MDSATNGRKTKRSDDQRGKDIGALVRLLIYAKHEATRLALPDAPDAIHTALRSIASTESVAVETHVLG
jgi:hypothetical protein